MERAWAVGVTASVENAHGWEYNEPCTKRKPSVSSLLHAQIWASRDLSLRLCNIFKPPTKDWNCYALSEPGL